jgi:acetyltransferase-like isoleucine patch superfamily enzyme
MWKGGLIQILIMPLPWSLRRRLLQAIFDYKIDPTAWIGCSIIMPSKRLIMGAGTSIGHLTLARGLEHITLGPGASIGNLNWIYGIPRTDPCLSHEPERRLELILDENASLVHRHLVDCSNTVHLQQGAIIGGHRSQIVSHGLSPRQAFRVYTRPVTLGVYSLVGTGCIVLGGAHLPAYSVLGAGSTLRSAFSETHGVYSGVPAVRVADIAEDSPFFARTGPRPLTYT